MAYTFTTWLFFFYFYCFAGWVWETCYVSVGKAKWVNRGFLHGPFLPIYGFGAVTVLIFTLHFRSEAKLVFFVGMVSATALEYFTGAAMERLFHVRYWDYSGKRFNLNGHICALSSFAWGVFSVLLTVYAHNPIERAVLSMNRNALEVIVFFLTVYMSIDTAESVRVAFDLKEILIELENSSEGFRHIHRRFDAAYAFYGSGLKEKSEAGLKKINNAINTGKEKKDNMKAGIMERIERMRMKRAYRNMRSLLGRNPYAVSRMHKEAFDRFLEMEERE